MSENTQTKKRNNEETWMVLSIVFNNKIINGKLMTIARKQNRTEHEKVHNQTFEIP